jgi:hypothetical protein
MTQKTFRFAMGSLMALSAALSIVLVILLEAIK